MKENDTNQSRFCGGRFYGGNGTIHKSPDLDVEIDSEGNVVAVWYRCQLLPFESYKVDDDRAEEMRRAYTERPPQILGIELMDAKDE